MKKILGLLLIFAWTFNLNAQANNDTNFVRKGKLIASMNNHKQPIVIWNDLIIIKAKVNGIEGNFIWDNGFTVTGLDKSFAEKCKIKIINEDKSIVTDGNAKKVELINGLAEKIQIGNFDVRETPVWILDVKSIAGSKKMKIDGFIGSSFINLMNWNFDFDNENVTLSTKSFEQDGLMLKYSIDKYNTHQIACNLNGYDFPAMIDFGMNTEDFNANIQFSALFQENKASEEYGITSIAVSGVSQVDTTYVINGKYEYKLDGKEINFKPRIYLTKNETNFKIGNRFFRHYNCIINSTDTIYILYERKKPIIPKTTKSYGIKFIKLDNKIVVGKLTTNPNITQGEIKLMEEVASINGKKAKDFETIHDLLLFQNELVLKGKVLKVKFKNGKIKIFKLENDNEK
ncbi:MAG: retropepsin-like aspartic protease [Saprospiraceae bacterium]|nr:retropepsin-like aspartic protease [Saprospiraceae bacterium]